MACGMAQCMHDALPEVTRFAPSPNGRLHLGHAYSAIFAHDIARERGGTFLLRIEDIDGDRSRPEFADEFRRDLEWLGLEWEEVAPQSTRLETYREATDRLIEKGMLYRCVCTRKQIMEAGARNGPDGLVYPGTCKGRKIDPALPAALRLDIDRACSEVDELIWTDENAGAVIADPRDFGDVVIVRKSLPASYHLAVTLDDASDGVTLVTRGMDLFNATHIHRMLQELLDLPVPDWHHHGLMMDDDGEKLAKSRGSASLAERRENGEDGRLLAGQLRLQQMLSGT